MTPVNWPQYPGGVLSSPTSHMGGHRFDVVTIFVFNLGQIVGLCTENGPWLCSC